MKVALVGNQNSGKTTLFNTLTGMNAKIGNWPGVTIDMKSGNIKGSKHLLIDLPGIYSLSPYSLEEEVSRKFILGEKPDVIINVVDSTSLERSLYLTTQLMELNIPMVIALNMTDRLEQKGLTINAMALEKELGVKVIEISALKEIGIDDLISAIDKVKIFKPKFDFNNIPGNCIDCEEVDKEELIITGRYEYIDNITKKVLKRKNVKFNISDLLDKILLNKWIAFPIFALVMFFVYYLSVGVVGNYTVDAISMFFEKFGLYVGEKLVSIGTSDWLMSLVVDGIIAGVGAVINFLPQLAILFLCISILETTGYMSRVALLLDKFFRRIGLSGKSLIPFIIGSGCSVPGIMGSRIIENEDERKMTAVLTPFIPCSAKLPIIALFTGFFFKENAGLVSASLYLFAIMVIIISACIMKRFIFKNISSTYISELPEYRLPNIKYVVKDVFEKVFSFLKRAGSVILVCSIVLWFLLSFSVKFEYGVKIEDSILAMIGNKISFVFYPMLGTNSWGAAVSAIQGIIAKEQVVSSMAVISGLASDVLKQDLIFSEGSLFSFFTASSAYAFIVFNLFSAPCVGAIGAMKKELGGFGKMFKAVIFQTVLAWVLATFVYQVGNLIECGIISIVDCIIVIVIVIGIIKIIARYDNDKCASCPYSGACERK